MSSLRDHKVLLICAAPGFGKTVLAAQWRKSSEEDRVFVWVSFDRADTPPRPIWASIALAMEEAWLDIDGAAPADDQGREFSPGAMRRVVEVLAGAPGPVVLVLDRFDRIHDRDRLREVRHLIDLLPPTVQLVMITRSDPPLPLSQLRLAGELAELRTPDLAFTEDEADALIRRVAGIRLRRPELAELTSRTEGWPAGVVMVALALRNAPDAAAFVRELKGTDRYIADYLREEVLQHLPRRVRRFLVRTSVLPRMSAQLCDAVLGTHDASSVLDRLDRSSLFIVPLDDKRHWYRLHRLFRDHLRDELYKEEPHLVPTLYERAGDWYARHGFVTEAVDQAVESGTPEAAMGLVERHWVAYVNSGQVAVVRGWLRAVGDERIRRGPAAAVCAAWISALSGQRADTRRWLDVARRHAADGPLPDGCSSVQAAVALVGGYFGFDGTSRMLAAAETASLLEQNPESPWYATSRTVLGYARYLAGDLQGALDPLDEAVQVSGSTPIAAVTALAVLSLVKGELGHLTEATELAWAAKEKVAEFGLPDMSECSLVYTASGVCHWRTGMIDAARADLEHALSLRWNTVGLSPWATMEALLALTAVYLDAGEPEEARAHLAEARRLVVSMPPEQDRLRTELLHMEVRLSAHSKASPVLGEPLTEREMAVLGFLHCQELSLREIGERLYVSVNTVKTHTRSIYRKLGVSSREELARRAAYDEFPGHS